MESAASNEDNSNSSTLISTIKVEEDTQLIEENAHCYAVPLMPALPDEFHAPEPSVPNDTEKGVVDLKPADLDSCASNDVGNELRIADVWGDARDDVDDVSNPFTTRKRRAPRNRVRCKFCGLDRPSNNFGRHLMRKHAAEKEVAAILSLPKGSRERKRALIRMRNQSNYEVYIREGEVRSVARCRRTNPHDFYPCYYCKGLYVKEYLYRHTVVCPFRTKNAKNKKKREYNLARAQTEIACDKDTTNTIAQLEVKQQVFDTMSPDKISRVAKNDLLIALCGDAHLKRTKRKQMTSRSMRELARFLLHYRQANGDANLALRDLINPDRFDSALSTAINFGSATFANSLGHSLKAACDVLMHVALERRRGFECESAEELRWWLGRIGEFKKRLVARWRNAIAIAKDIAKRPPLVLFVEDLKTFRDGAVSSIEMYKGQFEADQADVVTYKALVEHVLVLLVLFNGKQSDKLKTLKLDQYKFCDATLCPLTEKHKQVLLDHQAISIPKIAEDSIGTLLRHRTKYILRENDYLFAVPGAHQKWGGSSATIRGLVQKYQLENPEAILVPELRKHVAVIMQLLDLSKVEMEEFLNRTRLKDKLEEVVMDTKQLAKLSKLLVMKDNRQMPRKYKQKTLAEIDLDIDYPDHNDDMSTSSIESDHEAATSDEQNARKRSIHQNWSPYELELVETRFREHIVQGSYPSGPVLQNFIEDEGLDRTVAVIKAKIQYLIRKQGTGRSTSEHYCTIRNRAKKGDRNKVKTEEYEAEDQCQVKLQQHNDENKTEEKIETIVLEPDRFHVATNPDEKAEMMVTEADPLRIEELIGNCGDEDTEMQLDEVELVQIKTVDSRIELEAEHSNNTVFIKTEEADEQCEIEEKQDTADGCETEEEEEEDKVEPTSKLKTCPICLKTFQTQFHQHVLRNHANHHDVKLLKSFKLKSVQRLRFLTLMSKHGDYFSAIESGTIEPLTSPRDPDLEFFACPHCTKHYTKESLYRHTMSCACAEQEISVLEAKIFNIMKQDEVTATVKNDALLCLYAKDLLKNRLKPELVAYDLRLMAKVLQLTFGEGLFDHLRPASFPFFKSATKVLCGFDKKTEQFKALAVARRIDTCLEAVCDLALAIVKEDRHIPSLSWEDGEKKKREITLLRKELMTQKPTLPRQKRSESSFGLKGYSGTAKVKSQGHMTWKQEEKELVLNHFKSHILLRVPPRKSECEALIRKHPKLLGQKGWIRVKTLVFNTYRGN